MIKRKRSSRSNENLLFSTAEDRYKSEALSRRISTNSPFGQLIHGKRDLVEKDSNNLELMQENDNIQADIYILLQELQSVQQTKVSDADQVFSNPKTECEFYFVDTKLQRSLCSALKVIKSLTVLIRQKSKTMISICKILKKKTLKINEISKHLSLLMLETQKNDKKSISPLTFRERFSVEPVYSIRIENNQTSKLQTERTEDDDNLPLSNAIDFQSNQTLLAYIKSLSNFTNDVDYNEDLIRDLERKGDQNQIPKALARLIKEHRYLKICLKQMLDREGEQQQANNQRIMRLYSLKNQHQVTKQSDKTQSDCQIY